MEAYREYLELFEYFGRGGLRRLGRDEFFALDAEWQDLVARRDRFTADEAERFRALKQILLRDRP